VPRRACSGRARARSRSGRCVSHRSARARLRPGRASGPARPQPPGPNAFQSSPGMLSHAETPRSGKPERGGIRRRMSADVARRGGGPVAKGRSELLRAVCQGACSNRIRPLPCPWVNSRHVGRCRAVTSGQAFASSPGRRGIGPHPAPFATVSARGYDGNMGAVPHRGGDGSSARTRTSRPAPSSVSPFRRAPRTAPVYQSAASQSAMPC
jgi:hypothetical protein